MSSQQNIKCGWSGCSHKFGSEIDMNMHVMMNHMILLEHGNYTLNRQEVRRKRPAEIVREPSPEVEILEPPLALPAGFVQKIKSDPESVPRNVPREVPQFKVPQPVFRVPAIPTKMPRVVEMKPEIHNPPTPSLNDFERMMERMMPAQIPIPPNLEVPVRSPWVAENRFEAMGNASTSAGPAVEINNGSPTNSGSPESGSDQGQQELQNQLDVLMANAPKLSEVVDEFIARLRPMKQLGFIRPNREVYCVVCLKYVKSYHECNWKHTPMEDRIAEMWCRRFGKERPNGKNQLMKEFLEIKEWILAEEAVGNINDISP